MTRREVRDKLHDQLGLAALAAGEALQRYKEDPNKVRAAREIGPLLRAVYAAVELAEGYRQLAALSLHPDSVADGELKPAVPPWK